MTHEKRVVECDIENSVPVVAVTRQKMVAAKVIFPTEGDISSNEKETEETIFVLLKIITYGLEVDAKTSSEPAGGNSMRGDRGQKLFQGDC